MSVPLTTDEYVAEQVRRADVAMLYRRIARTFHDEAALAFEAGWEAVGTVARLTARRLERAANAELRPAGLP